MDEDGLETGDSRMNSPKLEAAGVSTGLRKAFSQRGAGALTVESIQKISFTSNNLPLKAVCGYLQ
jgi:hypothetical protein